MSHAFPPVNPLARPGENNILVARKTVLFSDDDVAVTIGTFPAGTVILDVKVNTTVAFNDTGSDTIDIGTDGDGDQFVDGGDIAAVGILDATLTATRYLAAEDIVQATVLGANGDATTGSAEVIITWLATDTAS
jgi:hypothetical protein